VVREKRKIHQWLGDRVVHAATEMCAGSYEGDIYSVLGIEKRECWATWKMNRKNQIRKGFFFKMK
jgi:hypothetical protein